MKTKYVSRRTEFFIKIEMHACATPWGIRRTLHHNPGFATGPTLK